MINIDDFISIFLSPKPLQWLNLKWFLEEQWKKRRGSSWQNPVPLSRNAGEQKYSTYIHLSKYNSIVSSNFAIIIYVFIISDMDKTKILNTNLSVCLYCSLVFIQQSIYYWRNIFRHGNKLLYFFSSWTIKLRTRTSIDPQKLTCKKTQNRKQRLFCFLGKYRKSGTVGYFNRHFQF